MSWWRYNGLHGLLFMDEFSGVELDLDGAGGGERTTFVTNQRALCYRKRPCPQDGKRVIGFLRKSIVHKLDGFTLVI